MAEHERARRDRLEGGRLLWPVLVVFLPFAGGYFLSYLFRSVNAVISGRLISDLDLDASSLGLLTSAYFLAFASFQLPLGLLLDRFGPRRVQSALLLSAALGALLFGFGQSLSMLVLGRALIGLGVAGGLMASFKAIILWFPQGRWPLVNSCFLAMGGLGAIAATKPVELLLQFTDWRGIFFMLAGATVLVSATIFLAVPERPSDSVSAPLREQIAGLRQVYASRLFWALAPFAVITQGVGLAVQGLWAGPWLRDVAGLPEAAVADTLLFLAIALTLGFVAAGLIADALGRRGVGLLPVMVVGLGCFVLVQVVLVLRLFPTSPIPWALFGATANFGMFIYPLLSRSFPLALAGRVNTAINLLVFVVAFGAQYAIGGLLDLWGQTAEGRYPPGGYSLALGVFVALQALSFLWLFLALPRSAAKITGHR